MHPNADDMIGRAYMLDDSNNGGEHQGGGQDRHTPVLEPGFRAISVEDGLEAALRYLIDRPDLDEYRVAAIERCWTASRS